MSNDFTAGAVRSIALAALILAVISICREAPCLAGEQNLVPSAITGSPVAGKEASAPVNAGAGSQAKDGEGCDSEAASDNSKADTPASDDDSSDPDHAPGARANQEDSSGCQEDSDADGADSQGDPAAQERPTMETRADLYRDSQGYRTATAATSMHFKLGDFSLGLMRDTVFASDAEGSVRSEDTSFSFFTELNEQFAVGGGFGSVNSQGWNLPIGSFRTAINLDRATLEAGIAHDLLATSAATIRNRVMQTDASMSLSYEITRNFVPTLEIHHIDYSDRNSSISVELAPNYTFHFDGSQLQAGYHFSYQSFATNPNTGYWAPQRLIANKLATAWIFDRVDYFGRLEASLGPESEHQIDSKGGTPQGGLSTSAGAAFGIRPAAGMELQCDFTTDRSPGWNSTQLGLTLIYTF